MKLIYILLPNDLDFASCSDLINHEKLITYLLSSCKIHSITPNNFNIDYNNTTYSVNTLIQYEAQTNTIYITFETNIDSQDDSALIINYLRTRINDSSRDFYYIICSLDESSEYYCNKIYPLFNSCERRLRSITYAFITKAFGSQWFDQTFNDDEKKVLKEKIQIKQKPQRTISLVENSLYELTWYQFTDYLFKLQTYKNLDAALTQDSLENKSKEYLLKIIEECRPQTKWEKYIMPLPKDFNIHETLTELRTHRNNVAHNKIFTQADYTYCTTQLDKLIHLIDIGNEKLKTLLFTSEQQNEIISDTYSTLSDTSPNLTTLLSASKTISEAFKSSTAFTPDNISALALLSSHKIDTSALLGASKTISEAFKSTSLSNSKNNILSSNQNQPINNDINQ